MTVPLTYEMIWLWLAKNWASLCRCDSVGGGWAESMSGSHMLGVVGLEEIGSD